MLVAVRESAMHVMPLLIEACVAVQQPGWLMLRRTLWPGYPDADHVAEMTRLLAEPSRFAQFIAYGDGRAALGFIEASVRSDYVNGTEGSPVGFVEGLYVVSGHRRSGIARAMLARIEHWVVTRGCRELASDALLDNEPGHAVHRSLGFDETERVVYFRKRVPTRPGPPR